MCGIVGFAGAPNERVLKQMCRMLTHRGPDDEGYRSDEQVSLGMRRLSIIDLAGGHQPIGNETGKIWVVQNGEIYNYLQLRNELQKRGHIFSTNSDTETIVHAYEEFGLDFPTKLRGMFACAVWDTEKKRLVVARDRIGEKPLYFARTNDGFAFASEIKSLFPKVPRPDVNRRAIEPFLTCGFLPGNETFYEGIFKLEPGHMIIWQGGEFSIKQYWELPAPQRDKALTFDDAEAALEEHLETAVSLCLKSDVEVGVFLSGGLDSSLLSALAKREGTSLKTFSVGYEGAATGFNELNFARQVSDALQTDHHEIIVDPKASIDLLPKVLSHYDEPHGEPTSILVYLLCEFVAQHVKVALGGTGADEIFYGYPRHKGIRYLEYYLRIPAILRKSIVNPIARALPESTKGSRMAKRIKRFAVGAEAHTDPADIYRDWVSMFPSRQSLGIVHPEIRREIKVSEGDRFLNSFLHGSQWSSNLEDRIARLDVSGYLPEYQLAYMDRMSMANSLEVRSPFCDYELVEFALSLAPEFRLKGTESKYLLKKVASRYIPKEIAYRKKVGFDSPIGEWLKGDLASFLNSFLAKEELEKSGLLNPEEVARLVADHQSGRRDYSLHLWSILAIECWYRMYFEQSGTDHSEISITDLRGATAN